MSAETSTRRGPLCVGLSTPDWPRGASPNGIVTHTVELEAALRELGVRPVILTWHVAPSTDQQPQTASDSGDILDISQFQPRSTLWSRVANKASRLFGADILLNTRLTMMARAARVAVERFPLDLIEIEEALGLALPVIELGRVPVVVRLHGPWFLNGRALGVKEDAAFARRDRLEREVIARADVVTAPSRDTLYWHYPHYSDQGGTPTGAIREGDWKLMEFFEDSHVELYNLALDPGEEYDFSSSFASKAEELRRKLHDWRARMNAAMPTPNPDYDPALAYARNGPSGCSWQYSNACLED